MGSMFGIDFTFWEMYFASLVVCLISDIVIVWVHGSNDDGIMLLSFVPVINTLKAWFTICAVLCVALIVVPMGLASALWYCVRFIFRINPKKYWAGKYEIDEDCEVENKDKKQEQSPEIGY